MHDNFSLIPLGAGCEVGRSCMYVSYKQTKLLLDCGVHPAFTGQSSLPFFDTIDLEQIDAVIITHFHLDHAGALPYLTQKTPFKGKIYMTHATKAILRYLLNDYIRFVNSTTEYDLYNETDLDMCFEKIATIDYHQEVRIKDLTFCFLNSGHVLGAGMILLKGKFTALYTGDYSTEEDRHLQCAENPGKVNILICESTYGVQCHLPRAEREKRFLQSVETIIKKKRKCIIACFRFRTSTRNFTYAGRVFYQN